MGQRIGIIGAGNVGANLAMGLTRAGHTVTVGVRDLDSDKARRLREADAGPLVGSVQDAVVDVAVVVLAVPVAALADVLGALPGGSDLVLVDATNAVTEPPPSGFDSVAAYVVARAPEARVVKAFNTIGAEHLRGHGFGVRRPFLPIAGDNEGRQHVARLGIDLGFDVADLGGAEAFRLVEDAARLWIHLAFRAGWGRDFAFEVIRR